MLTAVTGFQGDGGGLSSLLRPKTSCGIFPTHDFQNLNKRCWFGLMGQDNCIPRATLHLLSGIRFLLIPSLLH